MKKRRFKYIYGPVSSWRLGRSLGIDLLSKGAKACSFDCIYCQLGKNRTKTVKRKLYVPTRKLIEELKRLPEVCIDYITFSGRGEPTLAINLGRALKAVKKLRREPIAVLTNASLLNRKDVRGELSLADLVAVKLDADSEKTLRLINKPLKTIRFASILKGIKQFQKEYRGRFALQIMLMRQNRKAAQHIAKLAGALKPDIIYICTPKRPCPVKPLAQETLSALKKHFRPMKVVSLYDVRPKKAEALCAKATQLRRGKTRE
jgi:wyosine [tRNA(Phe)-imidazoG37] synthetase (radical SAM superfamily)